jgi:hypothetical protein
MNPSIEARRRGAPLARREEGFPGCDRGATPPAGMDRRREWSMDSPALWFGSMNPSSAFPARDRVQAAAPARRERVGLATEHLAASHVARASWVVVHRVRRRRRRWHRRLLVLDELEAREAHDAAALPTLEAGVARARTLRISGAVAVGRAWPRWPAPTCITAWSPDGSRRSPSRSPRAAWSRTSAGAARSAAWTGGPPGPEEQDRLVQCRSIGPATAVPATANSLIPRGLRLAPSLHGGQARS